MSMSDLSNVRDVHDRLSEIQLVDVREPYEWEAGRVHGAVHIPVNAIMSGSGGDLAKEKPGAVSSRTGNRRKLATSTPQARAHDAQNVERAMEAWEAAGLPFEAADGSPGRVA